jgi:hypothetical protein
MSMTKEEIQDGILRLEKNLLQICVNDNVKYESNKFYEIQTAMIAGFIAAANETPVKLGISLMARRPIIEVY